MRAKKGGTILGAKQERNGDPGARERGLFAAPNLFFGNAPLPAGAFAPVRQRVIQQVQSRGGGAAGRRRTVAGAGLWQAHAKRIGAPVQAPATCAVVAKATAPVDAAGRAAEAMGQVAFDQRLVRWQQWRGRSKNGGGDVKGHLRAAHTKLTMKTHHSRQALRWHLRACLRLGLGLADAYCKPAARVEEFSCEFSCEGASQFAQCAAEQ